MPSKKKPASGKPKKRPTRQAQAQSSKVKRTSSRPTKSKFSRRGNGPPRPKPTSTKKPRSVGGRSGAVPPRKPGKAPKKPVKTSTKRPKTPAKPLTGKARKPPKPVAIGGVKLPRKRWGKRDLGEKGYTNGRLRAKLVAEIKALKQQLKAAQAAKKPAKKKPGKKAPPKKPKKSRQERGFELLERLVEDGIHPREIDPKTGEEYFKVVSGMTKMSEHDAYATLMGSPPDVGVAA
jgi:hypothetical protein